MKLPPKFGIVADDLTGACDVAGRLVALGYQPVVALRPVSASGLRKLPGGVVVVNTRSRAASRRRAAALAAAAALNLKRAGWKIHYLKMDSTLRGNWAAELASLVRRLKPGRVLMCPAFPARGRVFQNGRLKILASLRKDFHGSPSLAQCLKSELGYVPRIVTLGTVRRGAAAVRRAVEAVGPRVAVLDAEVERDLATIGKVFGESATEILWAGSAGLARHVFPRNRQAKPSKALAQSRPWLFIQGSRQAISHQQFERLRGISSVHSILFQPEAGARACRALLAELPKALGEGKSVLVSAPREFSADFPRKFEKFLAGLLRRRERGRLLGGIFACGGSTAEAVCDSLRARTLRIQSEVRPGIPRGVLLDGRLPGLSLITKAGGFGGPNDVVNIFREILH